MPPLKYIGPHLRAELDELVDRFRRAEHAARPVSRYRWDPAKHPRGQPENAGQFAETPGIGFIKEPKPLAPTPGFDKNGKKRSIPPTGKRISEAIMDLEGNKKPIQIDPEAEDFDREKYMAGVRQGADEMEFMLGMEDARGKAGTSPVEWYTKGITKAIEKSKKWNPEIDDPEYPGYQCVFLMLAAITSINTAPSTNWRNTMALFSVMTDNPNGPPQFPIKNPYPDVWTDEGDKSPGVPSMVQGIETLNYLLREEYKKHSGIKDNKERRNATFISLNKWLSTEHVRKEFYVIRQQAKNADGEYIFRPEDTERKISNFQPSGSGLGGMKGIGLGFQLFGQKVPRFFANISGQHDDITIDKWAARTIARIFGLMKDSRRFGKDQTVGAPLDNEYKTFVHCMQDMVKEFNRRHPNGHIDNDAGQALIWFFEKRLWHDHGYRYAGTNGAFFENGAVTVPAKWFEMRRAGAGRISSKVGSHGAKGQGAAKEKARHARNLEVFRYALRTWDARKHPRGKPKNKGQFTEKPHTSPPGASGRAYVSPNEGKPTNFKQAQHGEGVRPLAQRAMELAKQSGAQMSVRRAVGDWAPTPAESGAEPSLELVVQKAKSYDQIKYIASKLGKEARQIAVIPWLDQKGGPDAMWELTIHDDPEHIRKILDERKLPYRTLVGQGGGKTRVVVFDQGTSLTKQILGVAKHYGIQAQRRTGKGEFFPADAPGNTDDEKRASAIKEYTRFIQEYEARAGLGANSGHHPTGTGGDLHTRPGQLVARMRMAEQTLKERYAQQQR